MRKILLLKVWVSIQFSFEFLSFLTYLNQINGKQLRNISVHYKSTSKAFRVIISQSCDRQTVKQNRIQLKYEFNL
jgi:hypothetical protein